MALDRDCSRRARDPRRYLREHQRRAGGADHRNRRLLFPSRADDTGPDSPAAAACRVATCALFLCLLALRLDDPLAPSHDFAAVRRTLLARLDPVVTVPRRALALVSFSSGISWKPADPIEPI